MMKILVITVAMTAAFLGAPSVFARDAAVSRALTLPIRDALRVMDSLSRAQGVSGAARAESFRFLGDYQFTIGDYARAAEFYRRAAEFDTLPIYRELHAASVAAAGGGAVTAPAVQQPATPAQQPAPAAQQPITVNPQVVSVSPANTTVFTVQVGAFGSKANADNLVSRLSGTYSDITISETASGEQTLFRVRVGSFERREDAAAFADRLITTSGLSARVVER
ncbi:MAG: SPOR domain-containing protein [Chitinispirillales bacterium]|jgi:cell division septation protein DedD|nr:SPOR domain-containing protein [Chitinispirillales bacterium]